MAKNRPSAPLEAPEPVASHAGGFWVSDSEEAAEYKKRFADQISRLQEKQLELVKQTGEELENLKHELEHSRDLEEKIATVRQPLLVEISGLQTAMRQLEQHNAQLEEQLRTTQSTYQAQYNQLQSVLSSLKNSMRTQAHTFDQQLRVFSLDATQSLESMLATLESTSLPAFSVPQAVKSAPTPAPAPIAPALAHTVTLAPTPVFRPDPQPEKFQAHEEKLTKTAGEKAPHKSKKPFLRKFAVRTLAVAILGALGFGGWHLVGTFQGKGGPATVASSAATGTVAGASTDTSITTKPSTDEYPEAFAEVPFSETKWSTINDPVFGITMQYPQNTSNKVRTVGGNDMWIIRQYHYMFKISEDDSATSLEAWQAANQSTLIQDYTITKGTFKNRPALVMTPLETTNTSGTLYAVKQGNFILTVWTKDEDPQSDDGQRITTMLNSLQIGQPTITQ